MTAGDARERLIHFAAEAHRRKWRYDPDNPEAFDALHQLGNDILAAAESLRDRNADSNRRGGHQRTTGDTRARDLVLPRRSPPLSTAAYNYGSEGLGFESLRARYADQGKRAGLQGCNSQKVVA